MDFWNQLSLRPNSAMLANWRPWGAQARQGALCLRPFGVRVPSRRDPQSAPCHREAMQAQLGKLGASFSVYFFVPH